MDDFAVYIFLYWVAATVLRVSRMSSNWAGVPLHVPHVAAQPPACSALV